LVSHDSLAACISLPGEVSLIAQVLPATEFLLSVDVPLSPGFSPA
jgi:hypothetical protein